MDDYNDFDLQGQLDDNMGSDYNSDLTDNSQSGSNYLQNQNDWNFGNYQDMMPQYEGMGNWQQAGLDQQGGISDVFMGGNGQAQGYITPQGGYQGYGDLGMGQTPQQGFGSGTTDFLSKLFSSNGALGGKGAQGLVAGLGALMEGRQNKKQATGMQNIVQQQQQRLSPYDSASAGASAMGASSMRDAMQQQLAATMQNPYGQPMVKAQVDQIQRMQAIKDAAAGRRSNSATSSPTMLAAQAQIAQQYMNSLQNPAGANISPNGSGLEQLLQAQKYDTQGYTSPMMSALGYMTNTATNSAQMNSAGQAAKMSPETQAALIQMLARSQQ